MNQINKYVSAVVVIICTVTGFTGCTKMDYLYEDYVKNGEIVYIGKVDSVKVYSGKGRLKLSWRLSPDPEAKYAWLHWRHEGATDSTKIEFTGNTGIDTSEFIFPSLAEGSYVINIQTFDGKGNKSLMVENYGNVYGDIYQGQLVERVPNTFTKNTDLTLKFFPESSVEMIRTELLYEDNEGNQKTVILLKKDVEAKLPGFKYGTELKFRSAFLPESLAIDTFYTPYTVLKVNK